MSPLKVLSRGYTMAQNQRGEVLRSVNQVEVGEQISIRVNDGRISATVMNKENAE
jgi:exodeoxyribonuclease VII large subunit